MFYLLVYHSDLWMDKKIPVEMRNPVLGMNSVNTIFLKNQTRESNIYCD